jgi:uncharacterized membrane protein
MIYVIMAIVIGFAAWQLVAFFKRSKSGGCASGCHGCSANGNCQIQQIHPSKVDKKLR